MRVSQILQEELESELCAILAPVDCRPKPNIRGVTTFDTYIWIVLSNMTEKVWKGVRRRQCAPLIGLAPTTRPVQR